MSLRASFVRLIEQFAAAAIPYHWGGKDLTGLDCSGAVTLALFLAGGPDWRASHWSDRLLRECEPVTEASAHPGDLALYGTRSGASHVMVLMPDGRVCGATGGGSTTTRDNATSRQRVLYRSGPHYRQDLLGFRRLPLDG